MMHAPLPFRLRFLTALCFFFLQYAQAQQILFSIPTSEITEAKKLFFQQQFNITEDIESSTNFTFGLGRNWEVGLGVSNLKMNPRKNERFIQLDSDRPEDNPRLILNLQKGFDIAEWMKIGIGTRTGITSAPSWNQVALTDFSYANTQFKIWRKNLRLLGGAYYANEAFAGPGNRWGYMVGFDLPVVPNRLRLQGDYLSGRHSRSLITVGMAWVFRNHWQLAIGGQMPGPGTSNAYGAVIQLSRN
jgi:hypothetical protein